MLHESKTITASDGAALHIHLWLPEVKPQAVIHVLHGMAEHAARYERLALSLTAQGWAVWADDHRGHGTTGEAAGVLGHFADSDGWERIIADQRAILDAIHASHPGIPVVTLGHSLGSIIARDVAIRWSSELHALVLSGAPGSAGVVGKLGLLIAAMEAKRDPAAPSTLMDKLVIGGYNRAFSDARTSSDWLSRDQAEVDAYIADPLCGFVCSSAFFRDMLTGLDRVTKTENLLGVSARLPVLVAVGGADPVANDGKAGVEILRSFKEAGVENAQGLVYAGARHEIFNELNREHVVRDIIQWIHRTLP